MPHRQRTVQITTTQRSEVISLLSDTVAVALLERLIVGKQRYSQLRFDVSSKTLSAKLKLLERTGLITRTLYPQVPPRVEYEITPKGAELLSILEGIAQWERSWL